MKAKKIMVFTMRVVIDVVFLAVGVLAGCQANSSATLTKEDVETQIKAYLDAHFGELLDNYYDKQWGKAELK